ncbi:uncharacterized protein LOC120354096 [Nilaparvata lugens]|uniref:uncharacterized protein LOC120354096 n=1 Tax=Nilaparvata lugens TaxID=108931 RepID=UPI00193E4022|nr:uncharacterized protein LOC120354096 [Nilaparvata lugens]
MESQFFKILILTLLLKTLEGTPNNSTELDAEDFLNVYFLPSTLVLESDLVDGDGILVDNGTFNRNADVDSALSTMSYHRSMINKYLCRNYLANEILSEVDDQSDVKSDRLGMTAKTNRPQSRIMLKNSPIDQNELLDDEGSDNYKKWLAKSSIFEDIYKHHTTSPQEEDLVQSGSSSNVQLFESGDITGFAVQSGSDTKDTNYPVHSGSYPKDTVVQSGSSQKQAYDQYLPPWGASGGGANIPVPAIHTHLHHGGAALNNLPPLAGADYGGLHHGVDYGGEHGYSHIPDHHVHVDHDHGHYHGHGHGHDEEKGLALKDLFDLALTALAFLAFGMFVLNLILTCFSVQPPTVVMMMNGGGEGGEETRFTRVKRGAINPEYLNQVSYNVVRSIDALASLQQGSPHQENCLRLSLCESNKFARELPSQQQVWVPVWSFGLSWISGKMRGKSESMLEYLRAIILGMGKAQCERVYSQCKQEM